MIQKKLIRIHFHFRLNLSVKYFSFFDFIFHSTSFKHNWQIHQNVSVDKGKVKNREQPRVYRVNKLSNLIHHSSQNRLVEMEMAENSLRKNCECEMWQRNSLFRCRVHVIIANALAMFRSIFMMPNINKSKQNQKKTKQAANLNAT